MNADQLVKDITRQIEEMRKDAIDFRIDVSSKDPVRGLPLTEFQKGLLAGKVEMVEAISVLIIDLVLKYKQADNENQ